MCVCVHVLNTFYETSTLVLFAKGELSILWSVHLIDIQHYVLIAFYKWSNNSRNTYGASAMTVFCEPSGVLAPGMWRDVLNYILQ